jgi:hypothetical protein
MEELLDQLEANHPDLEAEIDREWCWIITDLAPHRGKCECAQCVERAAIRKAIGKEGLGFIFARNGHTCPSGAVSYWGHHCTHPVKFRRRNKGPASQADSNTTSEQIGDAELLAMIGG